MPQHTTKVPGSGPKKGSTRKLSEKQKRFVEEYLGNGGDASKAYAIGYGHVGGKKTFLSSQGYQKKNMPAIAEEIERRRKQLETKTSYRLQDFMDETELAMAFALKTENATAYVRTIELRGKAHGHMVEKHEHSVSGFNLSIGGVALPDYAKKPEAIDVDSEIVEDPDAIDVDPEEPKGLEDFL